MLAGSSPRPKEIAVARSASTEQDQTEHNLISGGADAELASSGPATATVKLPFVQASLSLPPVRARFGGADGDAGRAAGAAGVERLALYGGTAALGVLGVVEWPVVLTAAGGTYLLSRLAARSGSGKSGSHAPHHDHDHVHDHDCGHATVRHGEHTDYLHDGHRHVAHDDHWDEH